jgi:hypothetical protein
MIERSDRVIDITLESRGRVDHLSACLSADPGTFGQAAAFISLDRH